MAASAALYDLASSPIFQVSHVSVSGNRLLTDDEIEAVASAGGLNLFWVRRAEFRRRLRLLPPVESADISLELPDRLHVKVREREPAAIWQAGDTPFLVDHSGLVLAARPPEQPLSIIRDMTNQPLMPGSRVDADAVHSVASLDALLTRAIGPQARRYEFTAESGLNVVQPNGPRLVLGNGDDLEWKVSAIQSILRYLESSRASAQLIDARFGDRPYFR